MRFTELREYYEAKDDEYSSFDIDDTRRPRLTLKHLNKLRKMREMNSAERSNRENFFQKIYSRQEDAE